MRAAFLLGILPDAFPLFRQVAHVERLVEAVPADFKGMEARHCLLLGRETSDDLIDRGRSRTVQQDQRVNLRLLVSRTDFMLKQGKTAGLSQVMWEDVHNRGNGRRGTRRAHLRQDTGLVDVVELGRHGRHRHIG